MGGQVVLVGGFRLWAVFVCGRLSFGAGCVGGRFSFAGGGWSGLWVRVYSWGHVQGQCVVCEGRAVVGEGGQGHWCWAECLHWWGSAMGDAGRTWAVSRPLWAGVVHGVWPVFVYGRWLSFMGAEMLMVGLVHWRIVNGA